MPYSVSNPVNFYAGGDTTSQAIGSISQRSPEYTRSSTQTRFRPVARLSSHRMMWCLRPGR